MQAIDEQRIAHHELVQQNPFSLLPCKIGLGCVLYPAFNSFAQIRRFDDFQILTMISSAAVH